MEFENLDYSSSLLLGLNKLRNENQLCDVILNTSGGKTLPAHKNVLTLSSPFFMAMFNGTFPESSQNEIHLQNIDGESLEVILNYIYTGFLKITQENIENLLSASCFLQIEWVQEKCCEFLEEFLDSSNCLGIRNFAEDHSLLTLKTNATKFAIKHFNHVCEGDEFLNIKIEDLNEFLSNDEIFNHDDDILFTAIMNWIKHSSETRLPNLPNLLKFIHPFLISNDLVKENKYLMDTKDSLCTEWVSNVLQQNKLSEWNIFILDKIGRSSDLFRYSLNLKQLIPLKSLPEKAFAVSLVGNKNSLYVQGGAIERKSTRNCYHYNIYRDRWIEFTKLMNPRSHHRSVILNNFIYALGGNGVHGPMSNVECFDLNTGQSMFIESMLDDRTSMGAVVYENCIYVMGGENEDECLYSLERFDPREGIWTELESMNQVNSYCSSAVVSDAIYCSEGLGNSMERYDFKANQWHLIEFQDDREFYELFSINDELYSISSDGVYRYCPINNEWLTVLQFPVVHEWDTAVPLQMQLM